MALKDTWVDKIDGVDLNKAEDINQVAGAVVALENKMDDDVLLTTAQTLTDDQREQVKNNLGLVDGEQWVKLNEITTAEDVTSFYINSDYEGNGFSCKKLKALLYLPSEGTGTAGFFVSRGPGVYGDGCYGDNISIKNTVYLVDMWYEPGQFMEIKISSSPSKTFWGDQQAIAAAQYYRSIWKTTPLDGIYIGSGEVARTFPSGTTLYLWGVRA